MTMHRRVTVICVLGLCAAQLAAAGEVWAAEPRAAGRVLTSEDFYRVASVSDPQVSADGAWVAYVVTTNDRDADAQRSAIWMASWDGGTSLSLTAATADTARPRWSPDGRYLSYIATRPGPDKTGADTAQLMVLDRRGGEARALTAVSGEIGEYAWSPDATRIAFAMAQGTNTGKAPQPIVIESTRFKHDEDGYVGNGRRRHLYLLDVGTKRLETLTQDLQADDDLPTWSPDGRRIAFTRSRDPGAGEDGRSEIDVMEARTGVSTRSIARPYAPNTQRLAWSAGGEIIYLQGLQPKFNAYMQDHLSSVPAEGGTPRPLAEKLDRAIMSYALIDSRSIAATVEDDGVEYPVRIDIASGAAVRETAASPRSVATGVSAGAGHVALLKADDAALAEVFALEGSQLRKLTAHNDALLRELQFGAVEDIRFKSKDGTDIHGQLVKPPSFVPGRKYPTVLWIHGGPNGQDEHALVLDGYQFEPQMFAAKDFIVLRVNYRGGGGRGAAFARSIAGDWGHKEVEDLLAGVDYVVARGIADPDRLAIGGWSYGGILTDYTIATDRRFKAAISGAGSANQLSTYGTDQYIVQYNNELGPPWRDTALWIKLSYPFFHADRIHTPTLFLGGEKDFNVPVSGSEQMYQALRTLSVPAQLVVYPDQHHVFTRPSFVKDLADRMSAWLERYVVPPRT